MAAGSNLAKISIGLPVRNGLDTIERCLTSILGQTMEDFEVVVSDNASDDGTSEILSRYAAEDPRIKLEILERNIGQHPNMNRVFDRASAPLFRWISADDWLEPDAAALYVDAMHSRPDAIGTTSFFRIHTDTGETRYEEYRGAYPDTPDPVERFSRMLSLFHAGDAVYDPFYGVYRRDALLGTPRIRHSEEADWLLVVELSFLGAIMNIDRCLTHRTRTYRSETDKARYRRRMHPEDPAGARSSIVRFRRDVTRMIDDADLTTPQRDACARILRRFAISDAWRRGRQVARWRVGAVVRRVPAGARMLDARKKT